MWYCVCVCPSHPACGPTPWLKCVHVWMSTWPPMSAPPLLYSYMETWVPVCGAGCVLQSSHLWSHTLVRMHICISTCIYVHMTPNVTWNIWILTWKHRCHCLCPSHLISVPTACLECAHASVCVLMSTWVPNSAASPLPSYMETWVPVCGTVCMFQSVHFWSHTLFRMCTWNSTCINVHLTPHVCSTPFA